MTTTSTAENSRAQFVRYAAELDAVSAHFEEDLETVVAGVEQYVVDSVAGEGVGLTRFGSRMRRGMGWCAPRWKFLTGCRPNMPKAYTRSLDGTMR